MLNCYIELIHSNIGMNKNILFITDNMEHWSFLPLSLANYEFKDAVYESKHILVAVQWTWL